MSDFDSICPHRARLGESPRWHAGESRVYWTDIDGRRLWRMSLGSGDAQSVDMPQKVGCLVLRERGGMLLAMEDGVYLADPFDTGELELLCAHPDPALATDGGRFNDGRCDPEGRFFVGTLDPRREGRGCMYVLEPGERALVKVQGGFSTFNGIAFHPDRSQVWYSDTPRRELYRSSYDPATGAVGERQPLRSWPVDGGPRPDGGSFDVGGDYWCAMYAGAVVHRMDGEGKIRESHPAPAKYTTMAAFAGDRLDRLVLTTGQRDDDPGETEGNPLSGCLMMLGKEVPEGLPDTPFAG